MDLETGNARPQLFRPDFRRRLRMHWRPTPGFVLCGLVVPVIYLIGLGGLVHAQNLLDGPQWRSAVSEPAAAVAWPSNRSNVATLVNYLAIPDLSDPESAGLVRNALAVLLGMIVLGIGVAVIARKRKQKVYIAADVERVLGFAPTAVLPDFSEAGNEVAAANLTPLATAIDSAFKAHKLTNCVFAGWGPGAGATSVATRVKGMLEALGNAPLLVNAADVSTAAPSGGASWEQAAAEHGGLTEALLRHAGDTSGGHRGQIVLANAAPLATSAETEWLVGHADYAIVVIASGATTHAELRAVANLLGRLKASSVGVVLNRVKLANADPAFRRSIEEMAQEAQNQSRLVEQQTLETLRFAVESGRASLDPEVRLDAEAQGTPEIEPGSFAAPAQNPAHVAARATQKDPGQTSSSLSGNAERQLQEKPWWLAETSKHSGTEHTLAGTPKDAKRQMVPAAGDGAGTADGNAKSAAEPTAPARLPRLTELRGTMFSTGIKELDRGRHGNENGRETERLLNQIAPFEGLLGQAKRTENGSQTEAALPVRGLLPAPKPESAPASTGVTETPGDGSQQAAEQLKIQFPKPPKPTRSKPRRNAREPNDGVEILPSRRGQYKKND
jgi:hypothetical protein